MRSFVLLLSIFLSVYQGYAQCGTDEFNRDLMEQLPDGQERYEQMLNYQPVGYLERDVKTKTSHWVVPVVFHIIHTYGEENISDAQIHEQMRILNEDFQRLNADTSETRAIFKDIAANMQIEFRLARIDPEGNCTSGITRTFSPLTDGGDQVDNFGQDTTLKGLIRPRWDHRRYLNIWVIKRIGRNWSTTNYVAGYAVFPWTATKFSDGIVMRHDFIGASGTSTAGRAGRTLTHEIGHWLGLFHPFQGRCSSVFSQTDQVDDTPPVYAPSYGCPLGNNTCTNDPLGDQLDMVENFMDYSNGSCQNMFSEGQRERVHTKYLDSINSQGRYSVTDSVENAGVYYTGTCAPIADFHSPDARLVCSGQNTLHFTDFSHNGPVTKWTWYFEGGNPAVSNDQHPTVSYTTAGDYAVKLVVENQHGKDSLIRTDYVRVFPEQAIRKAPFGERFEPSFITNDWTLESDLWSGWERTTDHGFASNAAIRCRISDKTLYDARYNMILPPVDLSNHGTPVNLTFRHAYASRTGGIQDLLYIWVSTNCGESWSLLKALSASNGLTSVDGVRPTWTAPGSDAEWGQIRLSLDNFAGSSNVWIRFEMRFRDGNSLYIDDINIAQFGLGVPEPHQLLPFNLYPNPARDEVRIQVAQDAIGSTMAIRDLSGRLLLQAQVEDAEHVLDCSGMAPGMYLIRLENKGVGRTQRLIINR